MSWLDKLEMGDPAYNGKGWFGDGEDTRARLEARDLPPQDETPREPVTAPAGG